MDYTKEAGVISASGLQECPGAWNDAEAGVSERFFQCSWRVAGLYLGHGHWEEQWWSLQARNRRQGCFEG